MGLGTHPQCRQTAGVFAVIDKLDLLGRKIVHVLGKGLVDHRVQVDGPGDPDLSSLR